MNDMSYKPEKIPRRRRCMLTDGAYVRARRTAKRAATRLMRRAAKADPEGAPVRRIVRGYLD